MPVVHRVRDAAEAFGDTSIPWSARLIQPDRMVEGSAQVLVVDVSGPAVLDMPAAVEIGSNRSRLMWQGESGQSRRGTATIRPEAGRHRVLVRLGQTLLEAGVLLVVRS
jgi:hypothetical protein